MKRKLSVLIAVFMLMSIFTLAGCGGTEIDNNLVGQWAWEGDADFVYTFNSDGSGQRGGTFYGVDTFTWGVSGDTLRINRDNAERGEIRRERWTYNVDGDVLHLDSDQDADMSFWYFRLP